MTKFKTLLSAVAIAAAMALVGCANPTNTNTNNYPPKPNADFDNISTPNGGSSNEKDVFAGKTFFLETEGEINKFVFATDGTVTVYIRYNGNTSSDGEQEYRVEAECKYKVDDKKIIFATEKIPGPKQNLMDYNECIAFGESMLEAGKNTPYSSWPMVTEYCTKNGVLNEAKANAMWRDMSLQTLIDSFSISTYTYKKNNDNTSYTMVFEMPTVTELPKQYDIVENKFDFKNSTLKQNGYDLSENFERFDADLWQNNHFPLLKQGSKETKNEIISATWKITDTGYSQKLTLKNGEEELGVVNVKPKTNFTYNLSTIDSSELK